MSLLDPSPRPSAAERFQVNLAGVLHILIESIYSKGLSVFIREFIQNCQDALTARQLLDPLFCGSMSIEVVKGPDDSTTVIFEDNGIGLTADETRTVLSTVAFGTKRPEGVAVGDSPFVGRFGIGALSAFLVTPEIQVITRHAVKLAEPPVRWTGRKEGLFQTEILADEAVEPGTRVFLRLDAEAARIFTPEVIFETAQEYGRYLPHPIEFRFQGETRLVNETPLWDLDLAEEELISRGHEIFDEPFIGAFPFEHEATGAKGIAFIKHEPQYPTSVAAHTVFIKRMLISDEASKLHPPGATFLTLLMNATHLQPNAGRDSLMDSDPLLPSLREHLLRALLAYLNGLHRTDTSRLKAIALRQHRCLTHLAESERGFIPLLIEALHVETTLGSMPIAEILRRHAPVVRYTEDDDDFMRLEGRARLEGDCIVRTRTDVEHRLIRAVRSTLGERLAPITSREYLASFSQVGDSLSERELHVQKIIASVLKRESCAGGYYDGEAEEIGRLEMDDDESLDRFLSIKRGQEEKSVKTLLLNRENPLVMQLINGAADLATMQTWIRILYQFALLQAREHPTRRENRQFSAALAAAFTASTLAPE